MAVDGEALKDALREWAYAVADRAADTVVGDLKDAAPTRGGAMAETISVADAIDTPTEAIRSVLVSASYASYTDTDTQPHLIFGNPLLRFEWERGPRGAGWYVFPFVHHPGTRGQHWFADPMEGRWTAALDEAANTTSLG